MGSQRPRTESIVTGKVGDEHQSHQKPNSKLSNQNEGILPIKNPQRMRGLVNSAGCELCYLKKSFVINGKTKPNRRYVDSMFL
jgi:hypothetical protein